MKNLITALSLAALAACAPEVQTSSGKAFLAQGPIKDADVAAAASVEPAPLRFPARIGVIRFVWGTVETFPADEKKALLADLPEDLGTLTQLGRLETALSRTPDLRITNVNAMRRLAASRHLDYLLVVSLDPYQNTAEALFLDVRTGYPHGSIEVSGPGRGVTGFFGYRPTNPNKINRATRRLARALKPQLDMLADDLLAQSGDRHL